MIHWLPRILSALLLLWWGAFIYLSHGFVVMSVFEWLFWSALLAITFASWKLEFMGGSIYIFLGLFYLMIGIGKASLVGFIMIPAPLLLIGGLFIFAGWKKPKK